MTDKKSQSRPLFYSPLSLIIMLVFFTLTISGLGYSLGIESMLPKNLVRLTDYENRCLFIDYTNKEGKSVNAALRIGAFNLNESQILLLKDKNHLIPAYMLGAVLNQHVPGGVIKKVWMDISGEPCKPTDQNLKLLQSQYQLVWLK